MIKIATAGATSQAADHGKLSSRKQSG